MDYITGMVGFVFYFLIKVTVVGDFLLHGLVSILLFISNERISPCVVKSRLNNQLYMGPSLTTLLKYWKHDYFAEKRKVTNLVIRDFITGVVNISSYKGETFYTQTNRFMYRALLNPKLNPNLPKMQIKVLKKTRNYQPMEKAFLISPVVFITSLLSKNFYKTIFEIEEIFKLEIVIE